MSQLTVIVSGSSSTCKLFKDLLFNDFFRLELSKNLKASSELDSTVPSRGVVGVDVEGVGGVRTLGRDGVVDSVGDETARFGSVWVVFLFAIVPISGTEADFGGIFEFAALFFFP